MEGVKFLTEKTQDHSLNGPVLRTSTYYNDRLQVFAPNLTRRIEERSSLLPEGDFSHFLQKTRENCPDTLEVEGWNAIRLESFSFWLLDNNKLVATSTIHYIWRTASFSQCHIAHQ